MSETKLVKFPTTEDLLRVPASERYLNWQTAFEAAINREYIRAWFRWHVDERGSYEIPAKINEFVLDLYTHVQGETMPRFKDALRTVREFDPAATRPIVTLFLNAMVETLSSATVFQYAAIKEAKFNSSPEVHEHLGEMMRRSERDDPARPFLFSSLANGYEHIFTHSIRMLEQFSREYRKIATQAEFNPLMHQLFVKLGEESRLSRIENGVLEEHFADTDSYFSFSNKDQGITLDINGPTPEIKTAILKRAAIWGCDEEQIVRQRKAALGVHYGCPAAFAHHKMTNPIMLTFYDVKKSLETAVYKPSSVDAQVRLMEKKNRAQINGCPIVW